MYEIFDMLLQEKGITAYKVAKETGVSTSTLTSWKQGKYTPKPDKLQKIADYLGVQPAFLTGESEYRTMKEAWEAFDDDVDNDQLQNEINAARRGTRIPVLGNVAAGIPIDAIEDIVDYEEIEERIAKTGSFFGLRIKGDSMSPRIAEGDTVIVRKQEDAESGDVVIVLINGNSATCKRLMKYQDRISLISFNPIYKPMTFTQAEIKETPIQIIGKVVENRQKY